LSAPFFVVGPPRSGTSLLTEALDAHPRLAVVPETWIFHLLWRLRSSGRFPSRRHAFLVLDRAWHYVSWSDPLAARVVAEVALRAAREPLGPREVVVAIGEEYARRRGASAWGEKTPIHALHEEEISALLPEARYIRIVRDPRDVVVSWADAWNGGRLDEACLVRAASSVLRHLRSVLEGTDLPDRPGLLVRYEELVTEPRRVLGGICGYLGVPFDESVLGFHRLERPVRLSGVPAHGNLATRLRADLVGRHRDRLDGPARALLEAAFRRVMDRLGYVPGPAGPLPPRLRRQLAAIERRSCGPLPGHLRRHVSSRLRVAATHLPRAASARLFRPGLALTPEDWRRRAESGAAAVS